MNRFKFLAFFITILTLLLASPLALGVDSNSGLPADKIESRASAQGSPLDLDNAIRLALEKSPYFVQSALEIDVRRLDESDSRYAFIPTFAVQTRYYISPPFQSGNGFRGAVLEFRTGDYNPAEAYFSLKIRKLLTQLAILAHKETIDAGILQLAQTFIKLGTLERLEENLNQIAELMRQKTALAKERLALGTASPAELKLAAQEEALVKAESDHLTGLKTSTVETLKVYLGLTPDEPVDVISQAGSQQALGEFKPETASEDRFLSRAFALQMQAIKEKLQEWQIILAYASFAPTLTFGLRNPVLEENRGYYVEMVLTLPIWEGNKRIHEISREKIRKRQLLAETRLKKNDLKLEWQAAVNRLQEAASALDLARRAEELAELKVAEEAVLYQSKGNLSPLIEARVALLRARQKRENLLQDYNLAALEIRHLTGDLFDHYVSVADRQE